MQTECIPDIFGFEAVEGRAVVAAFDGGTITSDAGGLLLGAADRAIRMVDRLASCFVDRRSQAHVEHSVATLIGQRIFAIALGYEDLNDHETLRHDPLMAVLAGKLEARRADCAAVAGKSTLNRLELSKPEPSRYHKISYDAAAVDKLFVDLFIEAHRTAPSQITLDLDATDDPLHGEQEGRFFHGYYKSYCYLPLYIFCGRHLLCAKLRRANIDASAGSVEEVARIVGQIRESWPKVRILLRADSGFTRDDLMTWCEQNDVDYLFGLAKNTRLIAEIAAELAEAAAENHLSGKPARRFKDFQYRTHKSWSRERRVVGKAESMIPSAAERARRNRRARQRTRNPSWLATSTWPHWRVGPIHASSSRRCRPISTRPARSTRSSIALVARWKTASRNASSICSPTGRRPTPCAPTSYGFGCRRWPMSLLARCAASPWPRRVSPTPHAGPSA